MMFTYDMPVLQPTKRKWWQFWKPAHRTVQCKIDGSSARRDPHGIGMVYRLIGFDDAEAHGEIVFGGHMTELFIVSKARWDAMKQTR